MSEIEKFIDDEIKKINDDERYHYPKTTIDINAPLALIQMGLSEKMIILKKVKSKLQEFEKNKNEVIIEDYEIPFN